MTGVDTIDAVLGEAPIVDFATGYEVAGNDGDLYRELTGDFLGSIPKKMAEFEPVLSDADAVYRLAHYVKGAAANIGASRFREAAGFMETQAHAGDLSHAAVLLRELQTLFSGIQRFHERFDWEAVIAEEEGDPVAPASALANRIACAFGCDYEALDAQLPLLLEAGRGALVTLRAAADGTECPEVDNVARTLAQTANQLGVATLERLADSTGDGCTPEKVTALEAEWATLEEAARKV